MDQHTTANGKPNDACDGGETNKRATRLTREKTCINVVNVPVLTIPLAA